jgi:hypothetical protein
MTDNHLSQLIRSIAGERAADDLLATLQVDRAVIIECAGAVSRGTFAMALGALLFHDLVGRVPTGAAYVADCRRRRERIAFDHAALFTVRSGSRPTGALPAGAASFARILEPLGYMQSATFPVDDPHITRRVFFHREFLETLPQISVDELHVERFSLEFQAAAERVFGASHDPLSLRTHAALAEFAARGCCDLRQAAPALKEIVAAFGRWHEIPSLADYRTLLHESPQAAWLATHGSALQHVTERVSDVAMTACSQRSLGRPVNATIAASAAGTVRRTAFKADPVRRAFRANDGSEVEMNVPGSFYGFISRDLVIGPDGRKRMDMSLGGGEPGSLRKSAAG